VPARRIWLDPYLDLALIEVGDRKFLAGMTAAPLECAELPTVGHPVGAFGHPWGLPWTGTRGIISGRAGPFEPGALLTDAPINAGNSGGPLISLRTGKVLGINTAALVGEGIQNINFVLAMKYACRILRLRQEDRDPSPPSGLLVFVSGTSDDPLTVARNYLGPRYIALRNGDIIQEVVGESGPVATEADFTDALRGRLSAAELGVERGDSDLVLKGAFPPAENLLQRKAVSASGVVFVLRRSFDSQEVNIGSIASCYVAPGSPGQSAGVHAGDTVESVDGRPVHELDDVYAALEQAQRERRSVLVELKRLEGPKGRSFFSYFGVHLPVEGSRWVSVTDE
jgi:S1-C subfamily serine protease